MKDQPIKYLWTKMVGTIGVIGIFLTGLSNATGVSLKDVFLFLRDNLTWSEFIRFLKYPVPLWIELVSIALFLALALILVLRYRLIDRKVSTAESEKKPVVMPYNPAYDLTLETPAFSQSPLPIDESVVAEIDKTLVDFEAKYNRKLKDGYKGWVIEDASELAARMMHLIHQYSPPNSVHNRFAEDAFRNAPDLKSRMLMLRGLLEAFRSTIPDIEDHSIRNVAN